jgi:MFS family permease
VCGAPSVEHELALSHSAYVALAFAAPLLVAALLEGGIALLSDVWERRILVLGGQVALAAALSFLGWTRSPWGLTIGLAMAGAASGIACSSSQALLVVADPRGADRAMVRWTLFAAVGDVLAPIVTAAALGLGFTYRGAMVAVAIVVAVQCAGFVRGGLAASHRPSSAAPIDSTPPPEPLRSALRRALRRPGLWMWLFAAATCTLLDELVVALGALRMQRDQGASAALSAAAGILFSGGAVLGAFLTDRAVARYGSRAVLLASSLLCVLALAGVLAPATALVSGAALFVVGVTCAPHHALAQARAYEEMPGNPGTVQAVGQIFVVVDIAAPLALGFVADRFGLRAAIACLLLQPVVIFACAGCRGTSRAPGG